MDAPLGDRLADVRDRALLLLGFAGALRRSELVALNVDDISEDDDGLVLLIHKSKTDQERVTTKIGIPYGSHDAGPIRCPDGHGRRETLTRPRFVDARFRLGSPASGC
jgi:integrase